MDPTWEKIRVLGSGRATTVWEGRDRRLDRPVAIEEIHDSLAARRGFVESYLQEARRMAAISDPRVLTIHAVDDTAEAPRLIVEQADGTARDLADRGPLQPEQAERLLTHALRGLGAIHRHGVVHRGIKPENLFICGEGFKVGDFGIGHSPDTPTLFLSSPRYTAPEQLSDRPLSSPDRRADLYSLGLVLYELLLGRRSFEEAVDETISREAGAGTVPAENAAPPAPGELDRWLRFHRASADLPEPRTLDPAIPATLSRVVARLAAKDPEARYQSAEDALRDLRTRAGDHDGHGTPPPPPPGGSPDDPTVTVGALQEEETRRRRRRRLAILAAVALAVVAAVTTFVAHRTRQFALVDITTEPSGADILFQGERVGTTPEARLKVKIGTQLTLRKQGFDDATVTVEDDRRESLHAELMAHDPEEPPGGAPEPMPEPASETPDAMTTNLLELAGSGDGPTIGPASGRTWIPFGEPLVFDLEADRDGTLVLFIISPDGTVHLLYPGPVEGSFPITARERLTLPTRADREAGFDLVAAPPAGTETVFALTIQGGVPDASPPVGPIEETSRWLSSYPFEGPGSPATQVARWIAELRRRHPEETGLAALQLQIVPPEEAP